MKDNPAVTKFMSYPCESEKGHNGITLKATTGDL